jgi:hypothetical protein
MGAMALSRALLSLRGEARQVESTMSYWLFESPTVKRTPLPQLDRRAVRRDDERAIAIRVIGAVEPTPFQRDLSDTHHKRLADVN